MKYLPLLAIVAASCVSGMSAAAILPAAPSWREIAAKYRRSTGAEEQLERLVVGGSELGARHWKNVASFAEMPPNAAQVSAAEARSLVRWILAFP
jgi:cytochrome c551/c552